jgi:hypothetical protein
MIFILRDCFLDSTSFDFRRRLSCTTVQQLCFYSGDEKQSQDGGTWDLQLMDS